MINDNTVWKELDKISELEEQAKFKDKDKLKAHHEKHHILVNGVKISEEQYNDLCDELTRKDATFLSGRRDTIQGYICQDGVKVKFKRLPGKNCEFGAYIGDAIEGEAMTYFTKPFVDIIRDSNPYSKYNNKDYRYKSDLDGKFKGLDVYEKPLLTTDKEYIEIRNKILKGEDL